MSARDAATMSNPLFDIPPIGRRAPASMVVKYGELADRVADFMGDNSICVGDWSGPLGAHGINYTEECRGRFCFLKADFMPHFAPMLVRSQVKNEKSDYYFDKMPSIN
ncbi:hypothetical protein [Pararhizobium sp. LjRoot238]|uniref:hypothetical protein n=1 Tax=Pararhizobium sp. LjRoot238 TaxID=3342293 RepID=UPI003ED15099